MFKPKAYKKYACSICVDLLSWEQAVYLLQRYKLAILQILNNTTTTSAATTNDATTTQAVYNADAATPATTQDETDAAILAARGDTTISSDGTVVKGSDGTVTVNNAALKTDDKQVKMVSKTTGGTDLDKAAENGQTQAVTTVEAQYVSSASAETVNPYVGKLITGLSISGVTAQQQADLLPILTERVGVLYPLMAYLET